MRRIFLLIIGALILLAAVGYGQIRDTDSRAEKIPGRFIVRFTDNATLKPVTAGFGLFRLGLPSVEKALDDFRATEVRPLFSGHAEKAGAMSRFYVISLETGSDDQRFVETLRTNPYVLSIEQDMRFAVYVEPNDPSRTSQWHLYQVSRKDIHAYEAWDMEAGNDTAIIAIIDTGVNYRHLDLRGNIWVNSGEDIDGDGVVFDSTDFNDIDDDDNGFSDDLVGYDFVSGGQSDVWPGEDGTAPDRDPNDFNGHGTFCAGIAAAMTNNGTGGAGVAGGWGKWFCDRGAQIMCLRAGYSGVDPESGQEQGWLINSAVAEAVIYAVDNGAQVINYSAGSSYTQALQTAMNAAIAAGIIFCHAAGNDGNDVPDYLGGFAGVLNIANTTNLDRKNASSCYGTWIDVAAPGTDIFSTYSNHYAPDYMTATGTSASAPMVAGLAGLIKSHFPDLNKTEIETIILENADAISDSYYESGLLGSGRINAFRCLENAPQAKFSASPRSGAPSLEVTFTDLTPSATAWNWSFGDGGESTEQNPVHTYDLPGLYTVSLEATSPPGTHTAVKKGYIYITADTLYANPTAARTGQPYALTFNLKNSIAIDQFYLPIIFPASGSPTLKYDSLTVAGTRTAGFDFVDDVGASSNKVNFRFIAAYTSGKNALPPGDGPIITVWFTPSGSGIANVDTTTFGGTYSFIPQNKYTEFHPTVMPIQFRVTAYDRGDSNGDLSVNVGDAVHLINFTFKGGWPPVDYPAIYAGDANADLSVNVGDAVYLINYTFKGGPPPPP